jgi:TPR repeat protein
MNAPFRSTSLVRVALAFPIVIALGGCVAAVTESVNMARDQSIYRDNIEAARAGNAQAQFSVGDSLCCSLVDSGFYDTKQAMDWLCQSARQGYGPAMLKVGQILSGDVVDGVRLARRAATRIVGSSANAPLAHAWFKSAEVAGVPEAGDRAAKLLDGMSAQDRAAASRLQGPQLPNACTLEEAGLI